MAELLASWFERFNTAPECLSLLEAHTPMPRTPSALLRILIILRTEGLS